MLVELPAPGGAIHDDDELADGYGDPKPIYTVSGSICAWFRKTFVEWGRQIDRAPKPSRRTCTM
jgi:hypothetical protein